ncbi:MAG TPA: histone deacetylase [Nitrospirae bacterium]|nr:histone deacetylase [Nitrospirota bacterium]
MKKVGFLYSDVYLSHRTPQGHPESPERLRAIVEGINRSELAGLLLPIPPEKASFEDIERVHTHEYIERIKGAGPGYLDPDTYLSEGTLEASLLAAGAVIKAVDACREGVVERAFCAVRPPGHHAEAGRAMGFCIFNNVASGARYAQGIGYRRVFIVDFDVHHGNGTEHIFYEDDSVFYFSTHQYPHYPGTGGENERGSAKGEGFTYNIPMPYGSGDEEYRHAYGETLHELVSSFSPDIILVSAGYDLHARDPLAGIMVTDGGIRDIVRGILTSGKDVPYVFVLEGGYDLTALSGSVIITLDEMLESA